MEEINLDSLDSNPSVDFGGGIELLMNDKKSKKETNISLEDELKIKKFEGEILTLQSQNKGLNAENLKLLNENYTLRYESRKCFCSIQ
jgi:hypothetical protein